MVKNKAYKLTSQDERVVKIFSELGMPKNIAKTLLYISHCDECRSAEIEHQANLRQPEVSVAMQELHSRGWIKKRDLRKKGKGRPVHIYSLASPIDKIVDTFEKEKMKEVQEIQKDLNQLKKLVGSQ